MRFVEFYRPTAGGNWVYDIFRFTLPDGYDETADLVSTLQAKFTTGLSDENDGSRGPWGTSRIYKGACIFDTSISPKSQRTRCIQFHPKNRYQKGK